MTRGFTSTGSVVRLRRFFRTGRNGGLILLGEEGTMNRAPTRGGWSFFEIERDFQNFGGKGGCVDAIHVGEDDDSGTAFRHKKDRSACPLLASGVLD